MVPTKKGTRINLVCVICRRVIAWMPNNDYPINANYLSEEEKEKMK